MVLACKEASADSNSRMRKLSCSIRAWRSSVLDNTNLQESQITNFVNRDRYALVTACN